MLINESAGSGGDGLPWMFRQSKLGPLVGKRTWGGEVGTSGYPPMLDGGRVSAPNFALWSPEEGWVVENIGGARKRRLRVEDLLATFDRLRSADLVDESAAEMVRRLYI